MPKGILITLTLMVSFLVAIFIFIFDNEYISAIGSILSGAGSILAVIWFSAGLNYQAKQLNEQRKQFSSQFKHLQEASRREALLLAKEILEKTEEKTIIYNGKIKNLSDLVSQYTNFVELKPILESKNPDEVLSEYDRWLKKEGAALLLLDGIKSAAEIYFKSIGEKDIDYSQSPEKFYFEYSPRFNTQPFFNQLSGVGGVLAELMINLKPGRDAAKIAFFAASAKTIGEQFIKMDDLRLRIEKHISRGYILPCIANEL